MYIGKAPPDIASVQYSVHIYMDTTSSALVTLVTVVFNMVGTAPQWRAQHRTALA